MKFNLEYLEKLANIVYDNDLSEITLEDEQQAVSIKREKPQVNNNAVVLPSTVTSQVVSTQNKPAEEKKEHRGTPITAPMVGTFYSAPSPEDEPFVKVGDNIAIGQVVCIIEAMKLMNEIEADVSGKVVEICVENGQTIEFGQVLMYIE